MGGYAPLPGRRRMFRFGVDQEIPEVDERSEEERAEALIDRSAAPAMPAMAPQGLQGAENYPGAPEFEDMPRVRAGGLREALKRAFLPGYGPGFDQGTAERRQDVGIRNQQKLALFKELSDRAAESGRLQESSRQHGLVNQIAQERIAAARDKAEAIDQVKREQLFQNAQAQQFREQQRLIQHQQDLQFFDTSMAPMMQRSGKPEAEIQVARERFLKLRGSDPYEEKIKALQSLEPSREQLFRGMGMAPRSSQGGGGQPVIAIIAGADGRPQPVLVDKQSGQSRPILAPTGGEAMKPPRQLTDAERASKAGLESAMRLLPELRKIAERNKGFIGFGQGPLAAVSSIASKDLARLQALYNEIRSEVVRRGGAAIPKHEIDVILGSLRNPRDLTLTENAFFEGLEVFENELKRKYDERFAGAPSMGGGAGSARPAGAFQTPDGKWWVRNPDGSMTAVP